MDGAYAVGLDPLYEFTVTSSSSAFGGQPYECKKAKDLNSEITSKYKIIEEILLSSVSTSWQWIEYFFVTKLGVLFPKTFGGSATTYYKSAFQGAKEEGTFCPWFLAQ